MAEELNTAKVKREVDFNNLIENQRIITPLAFFSDVESL